MVRQHLIDKLLKILPYLFIVILATMIISPLISPNYYYGHDTIYHVASVIGQAEDLSNSKILGYIAGDFGYGEGLFYPQLSHYTTALILNLIRPFGLDVFAALKITHFLTIILAGIFMYRFMYRVTKNRPAASLSSIFYITLPYFLSDIFIRDALAESFVFIFLPLVFHSLYELIEGNYRTFLIFFVLGFSGLLYSHLVLTMYTVLFLLIISPFIYKHLFTKQKLKCLGLGILLVSLISLPMFVPLLENRLNTSYFVFEPNKMFQQETPDSLNHFRLNLLNFLSPGTSTLPFTTNILFFLNPITLPLIAIALFKHRKIHQSQTPIFISCAILLFTSFFLMLNLFDWTILPDFLLMIQFPWRLQVFFGFALSTLAGFGFSLIRPKALGSFLLSLFISSSCIFCIAIVHQFQSYYPIDLEHQTFCQEQDQNLSSTSDCSKKYYDYYPMSLVNHVEYIFTHNHDIKVLSGKATIKDYNRQGTKLSFSIDEVDNATLELPLLYYLGYAIKATSSDGSTAQLPYSEGENGFIVVRLSEDYKEISVTYPGTLANQISNFICFTTLIYFLFYLYKSKPISRTPD